MNRNWILVLIAGFFEVAWVIGLKHAYNFWTWVGTIIAIYVSFDLLIRSSSRLPVGTVYAVFTGIGTAGTVIMEMLVFGEPFQWVKVLLILLLLIGVIGLKVVTKESEDNVGAEAEGK
ncbi:MULTISPECIES: DMT family transporter [Aneurinibacillus]|uniref:Multidrug efflux SMR transporter n=1 Tax=Aneurinibacillus thermoaerophilus TaxID=143495 RepID=A0A1G8AVU5_ANETH|nr:MULTISPECIES: multidrug efflux SMR transporter [Aneurinibacillus]AMA72812.1 multidrug resistance protein SMR [Aneurinibacillus sp. XH2]MED0675195.1 multidrug efflux SMR transporter [Aneurinibacillus thermoaerophilus]MED0680109.1 multidrug efflux SMR transporter [Aneurinibacillus thermoaerophilus]MED0738133.1 multidrug efflux SMR transporter [Aneurinibacillus thermoaerophilus]MED0758249.1 multidrug efflux SMR transporter [Aneurinibacillus thermoaerophilus]